jgi:hypothetical protein
MLPFSEFWFPISHFWVRIAIEALTSIVQRSLFLNVRLAELHTNLGYREYKKITIDYPLSAAKAFSTLSDNFKFVYVSGTNLPATTQSHISS